MTALFTPMAIGGVEIRNRIVMPSMTTRLADADGYVTPATIAYFSARAQGGVGLITVEMASPERVGRHRARIATGTDYRALVHTGQKFAILGDAARAGKGRDAIESAFRAAYFGS